MTDQSMDAQRESVGYEGYRGLTLSIRGNESALVHYAGVVEWGLETGASVTSAEAARRLAKGAVDANLDSGTEPARALAVGFAAAVPQAVVGIVVETDAGPYQVFHQAEGLTEEEDPYLTQPGWYNQPLEHDEPPNGPYDNHDEASEAAVENGISLAAAARRR